MFSDNLKNGLDFWIRQKTKFSRRNYCERNEEVLERNKKENLYTFDILSKSFNSSKRGKTSILDIGSKNWFYVKGEHDFFATFCDSFEIDGVELDAHRLYSNLYSRYETAMFHKKGLKNTNYIADDLLNLNNKYDYIIWFLPFVFKEPLKMWGLPEKYFVPEKLLAHAYSLLNKNGEMLIINQGEDEYDCQRRLLESQNIDYKDLGEIQSEFLTYKNKRNGFLVKKSIPKSIPKSII